MPDELKYSTYIIEQQKLRNEIQELFRQSREERRDQNADLSLRLERVDNHLERLNSKVATHEVRIAEEAQKSKAMAERVYGRRSKDTHVSTDERPAVTMGDIKRAGMGLGLIVAALEVLHYASDLGMSALRLLGRHQ